MEFPFAIILLPGVVNHYYPGGKSVGKYAPGIFQHTFLILIVHQFNPGIVLWAAVEFGRRKITFGGEMCPGGRPVCISQGLSGSYYLNVSVNDDPPVFYGKNERVVTPDILAVRCQEQRCSLVGPVV